MSKFTFGKYETEIDVTDVAFVEKYEDVADQYNKDIKNVPKDGKVSEQMRAMCEVFFTAFDSLFGEGTSKKMFGDKLSVDLCVQAFKQLVELMKDYSNTIEKMQIAPVNRAQRRAKKNEHLA